MLSPSLTLAMSPDNEFIIFCPTCGDPVDKRDLAAVLSHGWFNPETEKYECRDIGDVEYSGSVRVGEPIQWTKDKRKIDLN